MPIIAPITREGIRGVKRSSCPTFTSFRDTETAVPKVEAESSPLRPVDKNALVDVRRSRSVVPTGRAEQSAMTVVIVPRWAHSTAARLRPAQRASDSPSSAKQSKRSHLVRVSGDGPVLDPHEVLPPGTVLTLEYPCYRVKGIGVRADKGFLM